MQQHSLTVAMVMPASARVGRPPDERWPAPLATLFIVSSSLALWGGIYLAARANFG